MVVWTCAEVANCPPARVVKGVRLVQVVVLCVVVSCCSSVVSCGGLAFRNTMENSKINMEMYYGYFITKMTNKPTAHATRGA